MKRRLVAAISLQLFEVEEEGERRYEIAPLTFIEREGEDFRAAARALRGVAAQIEEQASPLVLPPRLEH